MRSLGLPVCLAVLCAGAPPALAQDLNRDQVFDDMIAPSLRDPSLTSVNTAPIISLSTTQKDGSVAAEIVAELNKDWLLSLKAEAPLGKGQEEAELANLTGLNAGSTATLGVTRILWNVKPDRLKQLCIDRNQKLPPVRPLRLPIPADGCSLESLAAHGGEEWAARGRRAQEQAQALAAVCADYNQSIPDTDRCSLRGLRNRSEDLAQEGQTALDEAVDQVCAEANRLGQTPRFILQSESENVRNVLKNQGEKECTMDALPASWKEKAQQKQDKNLTEVCQEYNESLPEDWIHLSGTEESECTYLNLKHEGLGKEALEAMELSPPKIFSLRVSTGRQSFKVADSATLVNVDTVKESTESKDSVSGTLTFGLLSRQGTYWGVNATAKQDYKGSPANEVCLPIPNTGGTQCRQMVLKAPQKSETEVYQLELRRFFSLVGSETANFGLNPRISYDAEKSAEAYQLILYFLGNEAGLNGGLDLAYRSDTDDFAVRAFVGKAFRLIPVN